MNHIAEEILSHQVSTDDSLMHYGMPRRSGRYPWGSGEDPYQRTRDLVARVEALKKTGWKETPENIEKEFGIKTSQYRAQIALAKDLRRMDEIARVKSLQADGLNNSEIGRKMGINESTVRSLLDGEREARTMQAMKTADFIREQINAKGPIMLGGGVERELGISREKMKEVVAILESEGYVTRGGRVDQATNPGQKTTINLIGPPGTPKNAAYNLENIHTLHEYTSQDGGDTFKKKFTYPTSLDSKRLMVRYAEDGGIDKDGIIELRRNVEDLSLGGSHYSQVRIMVDGTHYLKGMALYSDDMPKGVDVIFNTNKTKDVPMDKVLKKIKDDPDNPFGSAIKDADQGGQYWYKDKKTGEEKLGLINKRADEGDWTEWKDAVPSQFLSKQPLSLAKKQLKMAVDDKQYQYNEIMELTNPTVKKHLLSKFADECDSAAVHLQAAALPGQKYRVIIPVSSLKDNEVYAPTYENGTKLALVRYPHGGTFEIPILTVNNKHREAKQVLGDKIIDAVAINKKVADRLSGADFDGDTVMCIPTHDPKGRVKITSTPPLKDLEGFDNKVTYGGVSKIGSDGKEHWYRGDREYKIMRNTQTEMGKISNLITDMTLLNATEKELAKAVKHSMVVIDAEKHHLDYKQSEYDNDIALLKKKYQNGGASTLISKAKGRDEILKTQGSANVNLKGKPWYDPSKPEGTLVYKVADDVNQTVAKVYKKGASNATVKVGSKGKRYVQFDDTDEWVPIDGKSTLSEGTRINAQAHIKQRTQRTTKMAKTDDAYTLISEADTPMERAYADYANTMKKMANQARLDMVNSGKIAYSANAKAAYKDEVKSLMDKLNTAELNRPRERMATIKAQAEISAKKKANPNMKAEDIKKISQQAITKYRAEVGAVKRSERSIKITDKEWSAIQAGAISESYLKRILNNTDIDVLREKATPRTNGKLSQFKIDRIKTLSKSNLTTAEIAKKLGVSVSTVSEYMKGAN